MTWGYMKEDTGYSIILLRKVIGLPTMGHLNTFMINFIAAKIPLDWATMLSEKLCEKLGVVKDKKKFYMTSGPPH